ncbi:MAG: SGNH/GDSL hydrolase family protein [Pseudonocardia sediminis]
MRPTTVPSAPSPTPDPGDHLRPVRRLVALGDSTAVGLGDPLPGGGWRGFAPLLRDALGGPDRVRLDVLARTGSRMGATRHDQVPAAAALAPDVAVLSAGMNDTMRSDFDAAAIGRDCADALDVLGHAGAHVLLLRYHDHSRVFRLPGALRRMLSARIDALNAAIDVAVAGRDGVGVLDLHRMPGGYDPASWSVDRLHPSELGHRLLARGLGDLLTDAGFAVPDPVLPDCAGGRPVTALDRGLWMLGEGVPWLVRRGRDLGPVMVRGLVGGLRSSL